MSDLNQFIGVGPRTIQTAYVNLDTAASSTGTGEDLRYWDITLGTTLTDYTKATVRFDGSIADSGDGALYQQTTGRQHIPLARLTSNTNLRVASPNPNTGGDLIGRYTVEEWW